MPIRVNDAKSYLVWIATKEYKYDLNKSLSKEQYVQAFDDLYGNSRDPNIEKMELILRRGVEPEQSQFAKMAKSFGHTWRIDG